LIRKLALLAVGVLALSAIPAVDAGAATTPPTGTLACGVTGTVKFKPALTPATPASKPTSVKVHKAVADPCDNSGVTGGKGPITGGSVILNAKIGGASCAALAGGTATLEKAQLIVKLTGPNAKGKTQTVAVIKPVNIAVAPSGVGFAITGDIPQTSANNKPFGGESFSAQINVDNVADFVGCLGGSNNADHVDFSSAGGSTFSIS
jgi:hypothetical protein